MLARLVVRWTQFHKFYVDDFLIALSVGGLIATLGIQHYMFDNGTSCSRTRPCAQNENANDLVKECPKCKTQPNKKQSTLCK